MGDAEATVMVEMGFMPATYAIPDVDHPGLMRAGPRASGPYSGESVEVHVCAATDCVRDTNVTPTLFEFGFDTVDLSRMDELQAVFSRVRASGRIEDADEAAIRAALAGAELRLAGGSTVTVLHLAEEGLIMRKAGPNRLSVVGPRSQGMNDHGAATSVHADQDVFGTPLSQLMDGRAPSLFRHESPDGNNCDAGLMLVNMWIPLQQITQPLVLGDGRSVDRRRHQLRYGLATESFLERDDDLAINDIWTFLHDDGQRWYLRSQMGHRSAYMFDTLSTLHGSCTLPGEGDAEQWYRAAEAAEVAVEAGDVDALTRSLPAPPDGVPAGTPRALAEAVARVAAVMDEARSNPAAVCGDGASEWLAESRAARQPLVRMSLELRMVVSVAS